MGKDNIHTDNNEAIVAEPTASYGLATSPTTKEKCAAIPNDYDCDLQRAIPIEQFRHECHEELRRMYGEV